MSRQARIRPGRAFRERPATAVAVVTGLLVAAYALLTPTNVLLPVPAWGALSGTAYFVDVAVASPGPTGAPRERIDTYSRAEHALAVSIAAAVLLPTISIPLSSGVGLVVAVLAGLLALVLTVICWRQRP